MARALQRRTRIRHARTRDTQSRAPMSGDGVNYTPKGLVAQVNERMLGAGYGDTVRRDRERALLRIRRLECGGSTATENLYRSGRASSLTQCAACCVTCARRTRAWRATRPSTRRKSTGKDWEPHPSPPLPGHWRPAMRADAW